MSEKRGDSRRAIILTAILVEYQAVRAHLTNIREEVHPQGTIYERGTFATSSSQPWDVLIGEIGAGNPTAASETERAISHFEPDVILFVGVAGGRKDAKLGDVVAATTVYGYESGKAERVFRPRPSIGNSTYRMEQRARAEARKSDWLQQLKGPPPTRTPTVYVGPIAAGEKVIASTRSRIAEFLRTQYSNTLAVEMEGYGFLQATRANPQVEALVIRGISDLLDDKQKADSENFQQIAARHASAFAFEILARFDTVTGSRQRPSERPETYIPLVRNPLFQPRPGEFKQLEAMLFDTGTLQKFSPIGLVGMAGVGKDQLAAQIAYHYKNRFPAGIFWMSGTGVDATTWQRHLAELAVNTAYLPANDDISKPENEARRARHMGHYLANHPDALLILSNVEEPNLIISALPPLAGRELACTILYTSRIRTAPPGGVIYAVEPLSKEEAFRLLLEATRPSLLSLVLADSMDAEAEAVRVICQRVGYLPLALMHLHSSLARDQQMKLVQLSEALTKFGALKMPTRPYGDAEPLFATFWLSWEKVRTKEARSFFQLASFFPDAEPIPLWLLGLMAGLGESSDSFEPLGEARMELQELSCFL